MKMLLSLCFALAFETAFSQTASYSENVAATLDPSEPFKSGASLFWSPAGQAAWDELKTFHGVKSIDLEPHTPVADVLNHFQWDSAKTLPDGTVIFGGKDSEVFRQEIRATLLKRVGKNAADMIGPYVPPGRINETTVRLDSALFVSCISHSPRFPASFRSSEAAFRLSNGRKPVVEGFGCLGNETAAHFDVVHVLADDLKGSCLLKLTFYTGEKARPEFMIIGMRPKMKNLAEGIEWMKQAMKQPLPEDRAVQHNNAWWRYHNQLTPADHFWMPKLKTTLACDFGELVGKSYLRSKLPNGLTTWWEIREAQQLLTFRLNEDGALAQAVFKVVPDFLLSAGASQAGPKPADPKTLPFLPRRFIFDGPFIATLWMKGAEWPYLACWADSEAVLVKK
ncbi:MAG: hypothetical protein JNG86_14445 [Verrucomicrobiaceae bacterium]|nr:hypothetical protein [Verrucomicrobiaceae bacterium]